MKKTIGDITITIDPERDSLLTDFGKKTLLDRYCLPGETIQEAFARASVAFSGGDATLAQRLYDYSSKLWFSFATPLLSNGGTDRGLPISCFLNYVDDSIEGLTNHFQENAYLATNGGGIGSYWGHIRSVGEKTSKGVETPGLMPFLHCEDSQMLAYHQGSTRRGSGAAYIDISHPEIVEFINMRKPTGGDVHRKNENLHHGVGLSDAFMRAVETDAEWELIDPKSGRIHSTVMARQLWIQILSTRIQTGEPYCFFVDTANAALPQELKDLGLKIWGSNLCIEVMLATAKDRTAVCCLSSINLAKWSEFQSEMGLFVADLVTMLDNTLDVFIHQAPRELWRAVESAIRERSIGIGTLGFHTFLQQRSIPFEHEEATVWNEVLYEALNWHAKQASRDLAKVRGEAPDMKGSGMRHAHLFALAPNASSSIYCGGVSPSAEPWTANAYTQKTLSGSFEVRNPALVPVLEAYGKNTPTVWADIIVNKGSVQHLDFLTLWEKAVFRTAHEMDQMAIIDLAAQRQKYICQGQSVNLFMPSDIDVKTLHSVHFAAWKKGLKSLYYLRSGSVRTTEVVRTKVDRLIRPELGSDECLACEG